MCHNFLYNVIYNSSHLLDQIIRRYDLYAIMSFDIFVKQGRQFHNNVICIGIATQSYTGYHLVYYHLLLW